MVSNFKDNKPEIEANQVLYKLLKKPEDEESKVVDPKAKKPDPKAAAKKGQEEEKEDDNKMKITYEVGKENNYIEFDLHVVY